MKLVVRFGSLRCLNKRAVGGIVVLYKQTALKPGSLVVCLSGGPWP